MRVLLFHDVEKARRFLRRHKDKVVYVLVIVDEDENGKDAKHWAAAIKGNYGAVVLSGLILLREV